MTKFELKENLLAFETFRTRHGQETIHKTLTQTIIVQYSGKIVINF